MGLKRRTKTKCPDIPKEELEELCRRGLTDSEIAGIYGTSKSCIMRIRQIENSIEGFRWFRLTYTSSAKYIVFPMSFNNLTIIYLEGFEDKVTTFLLKNLANKEVPRKVVRMILKMNNVSEALLERI